MIKTVEGLLAHGIEPMDTCILKIAIHKGTLEENFKYVLVNEVLNKDSIYLHSYLMEPFPDYSKYVYYNAAYRYNLVDLIPNLIKNNTLPDELKGIHLSTYMLHRIIKWAKKNYPNDRVMGINLVAGDADDNENKERRNRLYEQLGYHFEYSDTEHKAGKSKLMLVSDLKEVYTWQNNITEYAFSMLIPDLIKQGDIYYNKGYTDGIQEIWLRYAVTPFWKRVRMLFNSQLRKLRNP